MEYQKGNTPLLDSPTRLKNAKLVQVVQNFFTKTSQVIAQARSDTETKSSPYDAGASQNSINSSTSRINKWFNLYMPSLDSEWVRQEIRPWKSHADLSQFPPMIIETVLDLRQLNPCEMVLLEDDHGGHWPVTEATGKNSEVVLERWLIEFDQSHVGMSQPGKWGSTSGGVSSIGNAASEELPLVYKQAIVLLRVVYGVVRLLPAYKARKIVGKQTNKNLVLRNRFIDGKQPVNSKGRIGLSKPIFPHQVLSTDSHMTQREFAPIHTSLGTLRVSVAYRNHYKFHAQDREERLSNHFMLSDHHNVSKDPREQANSDTTPPAAAELKVDVAHKPSAGFGSSSPAPLTHYNRPYRESSHTVEKQSVSPCASDIQQKEATPPRHMTRKHSSVAGAYAGTRPSIQPFKVGSIGSSSSPPYGTLASVHTGGAGSSMERRISITSNRSGSNASLVALLRNPRGSASSSITPSAVAMAMANTQSHNPVMPRYISSTHGTNLHHEDHLEEPAPHTPRFSSSFGSRQSRRLSITSTKSAAGPNTETNMLYGTSVELGSSVPFSGLYADDDISSFVQMIDGTSDLRLSNSNHDSKVGSPANENGSHFEALNRFQLLKSHYQHLSDSVNASMVLQQIQSRSPSEDKLVTRRSSRSTNSPAPSLPVGSYENAHLPSINSRLSKFEDEASQNTSDTKHKSKSGFAGPPVPSLVALPSTVTTIAYAAHGMSSGKAKAVTGLATSPSVYESARQVIKYEDVFEEDEEGIDYFTAQHRTKSTRSQTQDSSYDNEDMLFEMTDTK